MAEAGYNSNLPPWIKVLLIWRSKNDTSFPLHVKRKNGKKKHNILPIAEKLLYPGFPTDPFCHSYGLCMLYRVPYTVVIKLKINTEFKSKHNKKHIY